MVPRRQSNLALFRQLNEVHRRLVARRRAAAAPESRFQFPYLGIARPTNVSERNTDMGFATMAFHFKPAITAVQALRYRWGRLSRAAIAFHLL